MFEQFDNLTVRNATVEDADLLSAWWNDGKIMAHAGFPNGTGETSQYIAEKISKDKDNICRRLIVEYDKIPFGEMSYYNVGNNTAEIGIKICDFSFQNKGLGKILLSMLISSSARMAVKYVLWVSISVLFLQINKSVSHGTS